MDITEWLDEMRQDLARLIALGRSLTKDGNLIFPPPSAKLLDDLQFRLDSLQANDTSQIVSLYKECNGMYLIDVHNGYRVWPIEIIIRNLDREGPTKVSGSYECDVFVFGDDGAGEMFAVRRDGVQEVLFLREAAVIDFVYHGKSNDIKVLSRDFYGFLQRLQADFRAEIDGNESWTFMTD